MRGLYRVAGVVLLVSGAGLWCNACFAQGSSGEVAIAAATDGAETEGIAAPVQPARPGPAAAKGGDSSNRFAVGVKVSTLGIGGQVAYKLSHRFNVRGGANFMNFSDTFNKDGITYGGKLHFRSAEAHLDWFFLGPLHLSPGALLYNGNNVSATVAVPAGQTFTLNSVTYESGSASPLAGSANLTLNKVAPSILLGVGNMIPRSGRHFGVNFEIGGIYEGSPNIALNFTGTACTPPNTSGPTCADIATNSSVQANVAAEQAKVNHDAAPYKFYPVVSLGFSVAF